MLLGLLLLGAEPSSQPDVVPSACTRYPEEVVFASVLDKVSHLPAGKAMLENSSVIADLVREAGLSQDTRPLYGFGGMSGSEEQWMHTQMRFGMLQLPKQVGCMLSELAGLPTRLRTFTEIGAWYGWSGLFFATYIRRVFESGRSRRGSGPGFVSASFDVADMRTACVKALMAKYDHSFHVNRGGSRPKYLPSQPGRKKTLTWRPVLYEDHAAASRRGTARSVRLAYHPPARDVLQTRVARVISPLPLRGGLARLSLSRRTRHQQARRDRWRCRIVGLPTHRQVPMHITIPCY